MIWFGGGVCVYVYVCGLVVVVGGWLCVEWDGCVGVVGLGVGVGWVVGWWCLLDWFGVWIWCDGCVVGLCVWLDGCGGFGWLLFWYGWWVC